MRKVIVNKCYLELTSNCNLRCKHCYNDSGMKVREIDYERIKHLIDEVELLGNQGVTLSGGEPLLYSKIRELLIFLNSKKLEVTLITNATLIDDGFVQFIHDNNINNIKLQISLEGGTKETHDNIRGMGTFERIMSVSEMLSREKIPFYYRITLSKSSCNEVHEIFEILKRYKQNYAKFSGLLPYGRINENIELFPDSDELYDAVKEIRLLAEENKVFAVLPDQLTESSCPLMRDDYEIMMSPRIDSEGNFYFCQSFNMQELALGNINTAELTEIIESEKMTLLRGLVKFRYLNLKECKKCFVKQICKGGCPAIVFSQNKLQGDDGFCRYRKKLYMEQLKLWH